MGKINFFSSAFFMLVFVSSQVFAKKIIRGPYLQQPTTDGVTVRWQTDIAVIGKISFKSPTGNLIEKTGIAPVKEHVLAVSGLLADTKYTYSVGTVTGVMTSSPQQFFTPNPSINSEKPIAFWAMGDFGAGEAAKYTVNQRQVYEQFLTYRKEPINLWVWLGDNAYCCGTQAEYQTQVFDYYGEKMFGNTPFLPSPGNHEYYGLYPDTESLKYTRNIPYFDMITVPQRAEAGGVPSGSKAFYSMNYGNIHFISLDSEGYDDGLPLANKNSIQHKWLERDLEANKQLWTVIFFHHPPYTKRSHDSNSEQALVAVRESLVPVFDKYKVDLVLNGHSHVYERSFLMKNHTGHSTTFNKTTHVVQNTDAFYTKASPPIINKNEGTIYMVIGSAGRLDWNGDPNPHPSSVYSNYEIGGSTLFTVNQNRLDAEWIAADGVIGDRFTVFKNVNKKSEQRINSGTSVELTASWKGNYRWSTGQTNVQKVTVSSTKDALITVRDSLNYLVDSFYVFVTPPPKIATTFDVKQPTCEGLAVSVGFDIANADFNQFTYQVQLSDAAGNFEKPTILATGKQRSFSVVLPANLSASGVAYRLRIVPIGGGFELIPSGTFSVGKVATANLISEATLPFSSEIKLSITLDGSLPEWVKVTSLDSILVDRSSIDLIVKPIGAAVYQIEGVSNRCGKGKTDGRTVSVLAPLDIEENNIAFNVFPNPTAHTLTIESTSFLGKNVLVSIYTMDGKIVQSEKILFTEKNVLPLKNLTFGSYFLEIKTADQLVRKRFMVE